jgi:hypothetical protein
MSRMTITRYRDLEVERRRAEQREIQRVRKGLQYCLQLEQELAAFEDVQTGEYAQSLARIDAPQSAAGQVLSFSERRRWIERLPKDVDRLERAIAAAHEQRVQLEFAALSLVREADVETRRTLEDCARRARRAKSDEFSNLRRKVETVVTNRITGDRPGRGRTQSEESLNLAAALMHPVPDTKSLALPQPAESIESKIEKLIADIAALGPEANDLRDRAQTLFSGREGNGIDLKFASLMMDASELSAKTRRRKELREAMDAAEESLAPFDDPSSNALKARLAELASSIDVDAICAAISGAKKHAEQLAAQQDADRARNAILVGLEELGYEVRLQGDGWRPGDRIAVQKPGEPNYDVQLAAASDGRIQSKVRAYAHLGRSPGINKRDREVEGDWCADLRTLNERLLAAGIEARLDHEDAPGAAVQVPIARENFEVTRLTVLSHLRNQPRN